MKKLQQAVNFLWVAHPAKENQFTEFYQTSDLARDHPAQRRANHRVAVADTLLFDDAIRDLQDAGLATILGPIDEHRVSDRSPGTGIHAAVGAPMPGKK